MNERKRKTQTLPFLLKSILEEDKYIKQIEKAKASGDKDLERKLIFEATHDWGAKVKDAFDISYEVINEENIPKEGPVVFICNHQSYGDLLPFITLIPFQCSFIAKKELGSIPLFGAWIKRTRGLLINRGNMKSSYYTITHGVELLKEGFSFVIFPEGTRSHKHEMGEFKPGSFKLATKAEVPIVPVTLDGIYHFFEEKKSIQRGVTFKLTFHEAIETKGMTKQEQKELPGKVEKIIKDSL